MDNAIILTRIENTDFYIFKSLSLGYGYFEYSGCDSAFFNGVEIEGALDVVGEGAIRIVGEREKITVIVQAFGISTFENLKQGIVL